jgi:cytochrome c-type biogenesis protein CcmH
MCDNRRPPTIPVRMFVFWTTIALLACAATLAVVWPLVRAPRDAGPGPDAVPDDEARRLAVYRDRRAEIEAEREAGRLDADEAAKALDELAAEAAAQFAGKAPGAVPPAARAARLPVPAVLAVALFIPALAALVYDRTGAPAAVSLDEHELRGELSPARLDDAIARLRARTAAAPADGEGWAMLAEAQRLKGDLAAAAQAYAQAGAHLQPPAARVFADHADVLVALAGGEFVAEAMTLLERALAIDPRDPKTLAMMGAARYRAGRPAEALAMLRQLTEVLPAGSEQAAAMAPVIARLEGEIAAGAGGTAGTGSGAGAGGAAGAGGGAGTSSAANPPTAPAPAAPGASTAPAETPVATRLAGRIAIDPALADRLPAGTTLFIVARPADGSRMPLAVRRLAPERFPIDFSLGDGDAMTAGSPAWTAGPIVVEARLSRSGQAARASGDLFGTGPTVRSGARDIVIRIDQVVP